MEGKLPRGFHGVTLLAAVLVAVFLTWPAVLHLDKQVVDGARIVDPSKPDSFWAGNIGSDVLLIAWILNWDLHALSTHPGTLFDANMFYPTGEALARTEHLFGLALLSAPGALLGGPVLGNQSALLLCALLNAWLTAFVVARWTGSLVGALTAGILFAGSPFHQANMAHMQNLATFYLPLLVFAIDALATSGRFRWVPLIAGTLALQILSCQYLAYYAILTCVACGIFAPLHPPRDVTPRRCIRDAALLATAALAAAAVVAPFAVPYLRLYAERRLPNNAELLRQGAFGMWSIAGITSYVFGDPVLKWLPVPVAVWPLAVIGAASLAFGSRARLMRLAPLLTIAAVGVFLSLGPRGAGSVYDLFVVLLPGFGMIREPWRAAVLVFLTIALLAGHGAALLARRFPYAGTAAAAVLSTVALVSRWPGPIPLRAVPTAGDIPPAYRFLARCGEGDPLLELPAYKIMENWREGDRLLLSTYHWLPLLNGRGSYAPKGYQQIIDLAARLPDPVAISQLRDSTGVRWLLVHCEEVRWRRTANASFCTGTTKRGERRFQDDTLLIDLGPVQVLPRPDPRWTAPTDCSAKDPA